MVYSLTLFCTPENMKCDSHASLLACNLTNPRLGRKPKARVATIQVPLLLKGFETSVLFETSVVGFGPLLANNATLFVVQKRKKQCWKFSFLFQNGVNVVTYLTMENHKSFNTTRIGHYLSIYPSNLNCLRILRMFFHKEWIFHFKTLQEINTIF